METKKYFNISTEALEHLCSATIEMNNLINKYGKIEVELATKNLMVDLIDHIIGQLISAKAANTIKGRFHLLFDNETTPKKVIDIDSQKIRECGISFNKINSIKEIASLFQEGEFNDKTLHSLSDEEVVAKLSSLKGVGKWTAEMISVFTLEREDIWSYGDLGIRKSIMNIHNLDSLSVKEFNELGKKYAPYRSIAMLYYWHAYDGEVFASFAK